MRFMTIECSRSVHSIVLRMAQVSSNEYFAGGQSHIVRCAAARFFMTIECSQSVHSIVVEIYIRYASSTLITTPTAVESSAPASVYLDLETRAVIK